jgi:endonuclease/exonuclease/phosphatase family metal-dependent hydrolase
MTRWILLVTLAMSAATPGGTLAAAGDTLTVVTLNIWNDQHDWPRRMAMIVSGLRELRPDVICLQEVLQHATLRNQAETLADSLGCRAYFVSVDSVTRVKRYGNAILTPHRVLLAGGWNLLPADDYRVAAHVRIDWKGRAIDVYDTHLHHTREGSGIRATQIGDLLAYIDSSRGGGPLVLAGDFNAALGAPEMLRVERGYRDVYNATHADAAGGTPSTLNPLLGNAPNHIDHIFVARGARAGLVPLSSGLLFTSAGPDSVWASDHFGVVARLRLGATTERRRGDGMGRRTAR